MEMLKIMDLSRESMISEILEDFPEAMPKFQELGMHCLGCALATAESLEQACAAHGIDPDEFLVELKAYLLALSLRFKLKKAGVSRLFVLYGEV